MNIDNKNSVERSKKFLNNFYLYRGLIKYYENQKKQLSDGIQKFDVALDKKLADYIKILTSNFVGNEAKVMRTFNCNPSWPICLYDFTYKSKSNEFQTMRCRHLLSNYVVEDYFTWQGVNKSKKDQRNTDETDVVREQNTHLCQCLQNGQMVKNYDFVKNFKICYVKEEEILYSNENLIFNLDEENDIYSKKYNFLREVSGKEVAVNMPGASNLLLNLNNVPGEKSAKLPATLQMPEKERMKSENISVNLDKKKPKKNAESIISNKQLQQLQKTQSETRLFSGGSQADDSPRDQSTRPVFKHTFNDLRFLVGMDEWPEVIQNENLSRQQQDILAKLGNLPEKSKDKDANNKPAIPNATSTVASTVEDKDKKDDGEVQAQIVEQGSNDDSIDIRRMEEQMDAEQTMGRVQFAIM